MNLQDLQQWAPLRDVSPRTDGVVSRTRARTLFKHRRENGLEEAGIAAMVGKRGFVNLPRLLDYLFNQRTAA